MKKNRQTKLKKNFARMFWIRAFLNIRIINIVLSIFYVSRGITVAQIFWLSLFWAASALFFEVPSSYLADKWGRKKTIIFGVCLMIIDWLILLFAHGFWWLAIPMVFYGLSFACISGTDEALVYDTEKELGQEKNTLTKLGRYRAAHGLFKIVGPIIGVLIAKDLADWQFQLLILIDIAGCLIALIIALLLVEPHHKMDVEKQEAGVIKDGWKLLIKDKFLLRAILNKEIIFFGGFIVWSYYQKYFVDLGVNILIIGIISSLGMALLFFWNWYVGNIQNHKKISERIDNLNLYFIALASVLLTMIFTNFNPFLTLIILSLLLKIEAFRFPLFSELFNKKFHSYNRATTLSLTNLLHNVLEFPLLITAVVLVNIDMRFPYILTFILGLFVVLFLRLGLQNKKTKRA